MRQISILMAALCISCAEKTPLDTNDLNSKKETRVDLAPEKDDCVATAEFEDCIITSSIKVIGDVSDYEYRDPYTDPSFPSSQFERQYISPSRLIDLEINDEGMRVGDHFTLGEFIASWKGRYGILAPLLISKLDQIRDSINGPLLINSGYRSPGYNARINGASKWSRHMYGDAADMASPSVNLFELRNRCIEEDASFVLVYKSHIHCDWRNHPLSRLYFETSPKPPAFSPTTLAFLTAQFEFETRDFRVGAETVVRAEIEPKEESDELLVQWTVTTPSASVVQLEGESVTLFWNEAGTYKIHALIGGLYPHEETIIATQ